MYTSDGLKIKFGGSIHPLNHQPESVNAEVCKGVSLLPTDLRLVPSKTTKRKLPPPLT